MVNVCIRLPLFLSIDVIQDSFQSNQGIFLYLLPTDLQDHDSRHVLPEFSGLQDLRDLQALNMQEPANHDCEVYQPGHKVKNLDWFHLSETSREQEFHRVRCI